MAGRTIDKIIVHCSTNEYTDKKGVTWYFKNAADIDKFHRVAKGWSMIGYHDVIKRGGVLEHGRPHDRIGAHVRGFNRHSLGVCLIGAGDYSRSQLWALTDYIRTNLREYNLSADDVYGHRDFDSLKTCPMLDIKEFVGRTL